MGAVVVMGDFNAHLGALAGAQGQGDPNTHARGPASWRRS